MRFGLNAIGWENQAHTRRTSIITCSAFFSAVEREQNSTKFDKFAIASTKIL